MKTKTVEQQFQELADEIIERADSIPCPLEDYVEHLEILISELEMRRDAVKEELEKLQSS